MIDKKRTERISHKSLVAFFLLAYGITWGLSILATKDLLPFSIPPLPMNVSALLLHYGPAFAAIIMAFIGSGRVGVNALLARLGRWRVKPMWYLFIFLFPLLVRLSAVGMDVLLGGRPPVFFSATGVPTGNPVLLLPVVFLAVLFQAGLAEEIGWRGYGLPGLQQRYGALTASLILGVIWAAWHFHPLNFAVLWPQAFWYFFSVIPFTILLTWINNNTGESLLMAVLFILPAM
ncbi:MAG: CPBP family intramembrane metalloprotease [Anaerolineales bacterium]|nr:CPBP family intramembrane metalloprotease [Anaerolineales bacterium]